ncbi:hypothetical protein HNR00_000030 [Methylorubrum rhodinum]|uniref:Uncharacterized protein n=1 Tax=Methylorubrum rhodinum TaxID=29428 RepID=A0A840ZE60_9HYPH|nr:glycosyltransferase family 2 protein [Methylorubrum rhodinum]MBB5755341.1 hypothetical protein [Methylorubrum rhodinum]
MDDPSRRGLPELGWEMVSVKVACLMMQKNEGRMLDSWIRYHADLFGIENLYVFDNGSTDEETLGIVARAGEAGAQVILDCKTHMHFEKKGEVFKSKVRQLEKSDPDYTYFIFLDCDEFIVAVNDKNAVDLSDGAVLGVLEALPRTGSAKYVRGTYNNHPTEIDKFYFKNERKSFFERETLKSLDTGFHHGQAVNGTSETVRSIALLHFHNRPYASLLRSARQKLAGRVKSFSREDLTDLIARKGRGRHLVPYFLMSEADYIAGFKTPNARTIPFKARLARVAAEYPFQRDLDEMQPGAAPSTVLGLDYPLD